MAQTAEKGDTVAVHYTGKLEDGEVFDSSRDRDPLEFEVGSGQVIPGFDRAVEGLEVGESREVTLQPEEGYGEPREDLVVDVDRSQFPDESEPEVGRQVQVQVAPGQNRIATITGIEEETVTLDLNHPLAGKPLTFDVELVDIK
ncbi:MAG: peptidylprolyl isomerase [Longimicrobiales bacterium]|nr:peptidylprolyl isomerase [Longimicrobiales bacterium]